MSTLHVTNGDAVAVKLRAVVNGSVSITADVLHEGPAAMLAGAAWREQRARYLAAAGYTTADQARRTLDAEDEALARAGEHEEVVLWYEHDLYDQLLLIRTLDLLDALQGAARPVRISLIGINAFLGLLTPAQLRGLWPTRAPVTDAQYALARQVWRAFRQPDPLALLEARRRLKTNRDDCLPLPFLGDALERFFEEYPSTINGLSRTAHTVLRVLDTETTLTGAELFGRTQAQEARMFLGDTSLFHTVRDLVHAAVPLLRSSGTQSPDDPASQHISITDAGRAVLRGERDATPIDGRQIWRGGVNLSGPEPPWRWDPLRKTLISCR